MTQIITIVSPFIVSWLSGLIKNHALSDGASTALIRVVVALLALIAAGLEGWLSGSLSANFGDLLSMLGVAVINFIGATGIYHFTGASRASNG